MSKPYQPSLGWALITLGGGLAIAAPNDWAESSKGRSDGATRDYYNRAAGLAWDHFMGDWRDRNDRAQGDAAYAKAKVEDTDEARWVEWDVTNLVQEWQQRSNTNQGFLLRARQGGKIEFASREAEANHPVLVINGKTQLKPTADTHLEKSTYRSMGDSSTLQVAGESQRALLRFSLDDLNAPITTARLRLFTTRQYGTAEIGVFRCSQGHDEPPSDPIFGLAKKFPRDEGIEKAALFFCAFEDPNWGAGWTHVAPKDKLDLVTGDPQGKFEPWQGKALRVKMAEGANTALNTLFKFKNQPNEIYFRYYLRLADDWNQTSQGGKMPGISGTYGIAGWGGRKSHGHDGWSARGNFKETIPADNPLAGLNPMGTYCYHAEMKGTYGDVWLWQKGYRGYLENNRWYCIEQYLKLNDPDNNNGELRAWVDGRLAFEKTNIRFRTTPKLKIEQVWMNVYHGGTKPSPYDQHLYIDNVVIATEYIGPMFAPRDP